MVLGTSGSDSRSIVLQLLVAVVAVAVVVWVLWWCGCCGVRDIRVGQPINSITITYGCCCC